MHNCDRSFGDDNVTLTYKVMKHPLTLDSELMRHLHFCKPQTANRKPQDDPSKIQWLQARYADRFQRLEKRLGACAAPSHRWHFGSEFRNRGCGKTPACLPFPW
jgi:hypothetical protein